MGKDLPYFKFVISEWNDGDITLCSMEAQGLFINLCSMYWSREGELSLTKAKRMFSACNATAWDSLIGDGIIKIQGDSIVINFLDEQFEERGKLSVTNAENAAKGWQKRRKNATALRPHSNGTKVASNIEEKREEEKREEDTRTAEVFGNPEQKNCTVTVTSKFLHEPPPARIYGADGLTEYLTKYRAMVYPEWAEKFMRRVHGNHYHDGPQHVLNTFKKFVEKQYA